MKVEITAQAKQKLHEIAAYLEETAPEYRDLVLARLRECMMSLVRFPNRGVPCEGGRQLEST